MRTKYFFVVIAICFLLMAGNIPLLAQSADKNTYNAAVSAAPSAKNPSEARANAMLAYLGSAKSRDERIARSFEVIKEMMDIDFAAMGFAFYKIPLCTELDQKMRDGLTKDQQEALASFRKWYHGGRYDTDDPAYPAGLPKAGLPLSGSSSTVAAAPATNRFKEQEDCDHFVKMATMYDAQFKVGDVIYPKGQPANWHIYDFECATHTFLAIGPNDVVRNPVSADWDRKARGPFMMCPECHGHVASTHKEVVADDSWHMSGSNAIVQERKVNGTKVANVTEYCKHCQGKGYVRKD